MRDRLKARLDVGVQHPPVALGAVPLDLGDRVVCPPHRPEPVGDRQEVGLEDGFQHQLQRRLNHPVRDRRDPELADPARPCRLGNQALPHRQRPERAVPQGGSQVVQEPGHPGLLLDVGDRQAVHARSVGAPVARDPGERHAQRRRVVHEVEQVIEPAGQDRPPPNGEAWPASPLPVPAAPPGPGHRHRRSAAHLAALQPPLLLDTAAALPHVHGLSPARSTTAAPPHPARSVVGAPIPPTRLAAGPDGNWDQAVPVFTVVRSTKEEPDSAPAASPRLPRSTSPWSPGRSLKASPGVPHPNTTQGWVRAAPGPDPPDFEPVQPLRGVNAGSLRTPFRHARRHRAIWQYWHASALSGPLATLPGTTQVRLPPAPPPCCDRQAVKVSHLHSNSQRLTAHSTTAEN
jgi:hypothetical protein